MIDLQGEIGAFLVDDGVLGVDQVFVVQVGDSLVANELDRHNVPFVRLEVVGAFAVAHGKPGTPVVLGGLDEEVIPANVDDRVVVPGGTGDQADVLGAIEAELEADNGILEVGFLVEKALVLARYFVSTQDAVFHQPLLLEKPVFAYLSLGEMIAETQVLGSGEQGPRGDSSSRLVAPRAELGLQFANTLGLLPSQVLLFGRVLCQVE